MLYYLYESRLRIERAFRENLKALLICTKGSRYRPVAGLLFLERRNRQAGLLRTGGVYLVGNANVPS